MGVVFISTLSKICRIHKGVKAGLQSVKCDDNRVYGDMQIKQALQTEGISPFFSRNSRFSPELDVEHCKHFPKTRSTKYTVL